MSLTKNEIDEIIDDVSYGITELYYEKMSMSDIALLNMAIMLLKTKFDEKLSEETTVNE